MNDTIKGWIVYNLILMTVTTVFAVILHGDIVFCYAFVFLLGNVVWVLFPKIR